MTNMGWFLAFGIVGLVGLACWAVVADANAWSEFSAAHDCKIVGRSTGSASTGYGIGANGKGGMVTTYTPGKTGYLCDDGVTYWR